LSAFLGVHLRPDGGNLRFVNFDQVTRRLRRNSGTLPTFKSRSHPACAIGTPS
jgi:hypothetical protein